MKLQGRTRKFFWTQAKADVWKDLWIYLTANGGGPIRSTDVGKALGIEPRTLVALCRLLPDKFRTEYRNSTGDGRPAATYLLIAPQAIAAPPPIPAEHKAVLSTNTCGALVGSDGSAKIGTGEG